MQTLSFDVGGMTCGGCRAKVERRLGLLDGVSQATVVLQPGVATVVLDPELVSEAQILTTIKEAGFTAAAQPSALSP